MSKSISFENRDKLIQIGITIATLRRMRGMSQETLAEKANISRSQLSSIEAPGLAHNFTIEVLLNISKALEVDPAELIRASVIPDALLNSKK